MKHSNLLNKKIENVFKKLHQRKEIDSKIVKQFKKVLKLLFYLILCYFIHILEKFEGTAHLLEFQKSYSQIRL